MASPRRHGITGIRPRSEALLSLDQKRTNRRISKGEDPGGHQDHSESDGCDCNFSDCTHGEGTQTLRLELLKVGSKSNASEC